MFVNLVVKTSYNTNKLLISYSCLVFLAHFAKMNAMLTKKTHLFIYKKDINSMK